MTIRLGNPSDQPWLGRSAEEAKREFAGYDDVSGRVLAGGVEVQEPSTLLDRFPQWLDAHAVAVPLSPSHEWRPEHLSLRLYGTPDLWWLLLRLNGFRAAWEFHGTHVRVLDPAALQDFLGLVERWRGGGVETVPDGGAWLRELPEGL